LKIFFYINIKKEFPNLSIQTFIRWGEAKKIFCFDFNYPVFSSAAKSTPFSPCTNHPIKCDLCQGIHCSYNLKIHYQQNHPSICFSDDKVISNKELSALKKLVIYS